MAMRNEDRQAWQAAFALALRLTRKEPASVCAGNAPAEAVEAAPLQPPQTHHRENSD